MKTQEKTLITNQIQPPMTLSGFSLVFSSQYLIVNYLKSPIIFKTSISMKLFTLLLTYIEFKTTSTILKRVINIWFFVSFGSTKHLKSVRNNFLCSEVSVQHHNIKIC